MMTAPRSYLVSMWDHEIQAFVVYRSRLTKWQIRQALRELYARGYGRPSIGVENENEEA